jgi:hypothetical protein
MNRQDLSSESPAPSTGQRLRLHVEVRGAVQGVGFRPFVYRLANELTLFRLGQQFAAGRRPRG